MKERKDQSKLVVVVSPNKGLIYPQEEALFKKRDYVCFHDEARIEKSEHICEQCQLILINQCQNKENIEKAINRLGNIKKDIIIWTHGSMVDRYPAITKNQIKDLLPTNINIIACESFHHNADHDAEKYMYYFREKKKPELTNILKRYSSLHNETEIETLRCEILTPLVAFDLLNQAKLAANETKLVEKIQQAIKKNNTDNKFSELVGLFKNDKSDDTFDGCKVLYDNICRKALSNEQVNHEDYHEQLKQLAQELEQRINRQAR